MRYYFYKVRQFIKPFNEFIKSQANQDNRHRTNIILSIVITFFTFILSVVSVWQILEYRNAVKIESRAYVMITEVEPIVIKPFEYVTFRTRLKNTGKTPAYNINRRIGVEVGSMLTKRYLDSLNFLPTGYGFDLGSDLPASVEDNIFRLTDSLYKRVYDMDSVAIFIYGRFDYKDEFDEQHFKTFAVRFDPKRNKFDFIPFGYGGR